MKVYNFFTKDWNSTEELFDMFYEETNEDIDGFRVGIDSYLQNKNKYNEFFGSSEKELKGYIIGKDYACFNKELLLKKGWL